MQHGELQLIFGRDHADIPHHRLIHVTRSITTLGTALPLADVCTLFSAFLV